MSSTEQVSSEREYRGINADGDYYYKEQVFKLRQVPAELINKWDNTIDEMIRSTNITMDGIKQEKELAEEILRNALIGYDEKVSNSLHPRVKKGIAGDLLIFLLASPPSEEKSLLQNRSIRISNIQKSQEP